MCDVMARAPTLGFLSNITVRWSALAVYKAQQQPAGPPPTIATSHSTSSIILSWVRRVWRSGRLDSVRASEHLHTANSKARRLGGRRRLALIGRAMAWRGAGALASIVSGWGWCAAAGGLVCEFFGRLRQWLLPSAHARFSLVSGFRARDPSSTGEQRPETIRASLVKQDVRFSFRPKRHVIGPLSRQPN